MDANARIATVQGETLASAQKWYIRAQDCSKLWYANSSGYKYIKTLTREYNTMAEACAFILFFLHSVFFSFFLFFYTL